MPRARIGELAEQAGISTKAIRYSEQVSVLASPTRTPSGSRDYDHAALGRLALVRAAQAVGYSLVLGGLTLVWKRVEMLAEGLAVVAFLFAGISCRSRSCPAGWRPSAGCFPSPTAGSTCAPCWSTGGP